MPKIPGIPGSYRFFFYSFDCHEPRHVHARPERTTCKYWLDPISLASNEGFAAHELRDIRRIIEEHYDEILEAWDEHCGQ
jgi:hypothetical protein